VCNAQCISFVESAVSKADVEGRDVLEVGAFDVNGTPRPYLESLGPKRYLGVDISEGPGVDEVCDAEDLVATYGEASFDLVVTTEMLEHVRDWKTVVDNIKRVTRPGGLIVVTTRSRGFALHGFPHDHWRYEPEDMRAIFADCTIERLERDITPGIFVAARRPTADDWQPLDLSGYALWSIHSDTRVLVAEDAPPPPSADVALSASQAEAQALRTRVERLEGSKTFRYTAPLRRGVTKARRYWQDRRS
jgi:SAM-dependent methyltransferase